MELVVEIQLQTEIESVYTDLIEIVKSWKNRIILIDILGLRKEEK